MEGTREQLQTLALHKFVKGLSLRNIERTPKVSWLQSFVATWNIIFSKKKRNSKNVIVKTHSVYPQEHLEQLNQWKKDMLTSQGHGFDTSS